MKLLLITSSLLALATSSQAATSLFLGLEYQGQTTAGATPGTIRSGDPASDSAFSDYLGTAGLTNADILSGDGCATATPGTYATWGSIANNSTALNLGATTADVSIVGWDGAETTPQAAQP